MFLKHTPVLIALLALFFFSCRDQSIDPTDNTPKMSINLQYNECSGPVEHSMYANVAYRVVYGDMPNPIPNGYEYAWDLGDGSIDTKQNFSHTYTKVGNYSIKLTLKKGSNVWKKDTSFEVLPKPKLLGDDNVEIKPLKLFAKDEFIYCLYATQLITSSNYQLSLLKLNKNLDSLGTIPLSGVINNVNYIYKIHLTARNTIGILEYTTYKEFDFDGKLLKEYSLFYSEPSDIIFEADGTILSVNVNRSFLTNSMTITRSKLDINQMRPQKMYNFSLPTGNMTVKSPKFDKDKNIVTAVFDNECCSAKFNCYKIDTLGNKLWEKTIDGAFLDLHIQDDGYVLVYLTTDIVTRKQSFKISKIGFNGDSLFTTVADVEYIFEPRLYPTVCNKQNDLIWLVLPNLRILGVNATGKITLNKAYGNIGGGCYPETTNDLYIPDADKKLTLVKHFTFYDPGRFSPSKIGLFWTDRNGKIIEK
jgi:hypothetical protein